LNQAKLTWAAAQNAAGAENAGEILRTINPMAKCQPEVDAFIKSINSKLRADEKAKWEFKVKQYQDRVAMQKEEMRIADEKSQRDDVYRENQAKRNVELDKIRVKAYRDVAVEYARNQPKTVTYNNIYWR
jgi:dihydroxyacid dehydratase/phosphogluconate dehydratase